MTVLFALIRPFLGYIVGGVAIIGVLTGIYFKIRHDAQAEVLVKIEKEKTDAIQKASAARDRIRALCDSDPSKCVPDDWFRD
jgi:hypothetical protein